jgi:uncharacterized protein (TIGR00297 family)
MLLSIVTMRYMPFLAAKAGQHAPRQNKSRNRSSPAANAVALFCAAGLLAMMVWLRGAALLHSGNHLYVAIAITLAFALAARLARGVNTLGALAGAFTAFIVASVDLKIFWVLLVVFCVTLAATRVGASRKHRLGVAETETGRSASQVMANLGVAALVLAIPSLGRGYILALAALAEVAADTTSSEIGAALSARTVLVTTWKAVPPGTDGGISLGGSGAGLVAAGITAVCAAALGLVSALGALVIVCAGAAGMLVDSMLGATLEQRGYLNNDLVNLLGTTAAALVALLAFGS